MTKSSDLSDRKKLPSASGQASRVEYLLVSDRATSNLVVCQRPPKCNQCDKYAFRRRCQDDLTTLTNRPFAGLPRQCLELIDKLGPPHQSSQMKLHR